MTDFTAAQSALGYLYQARYALLLLLRGDLDARVSLERLDDVTFQQGNDPIELIQTKHHVNRTAVLTDSCEDLWKTIRIWSTSISQKDIDITNVKLALVTTGRASECSAAAYLRPTSQENRNPDSALAILREVANASRSKANSEAYIAFKQLKPSQQQKLVESICVLDAAPSIMDTKSDIQRLLSVAVRESHLSSIYHRVQGWWFERVIEHLMAPSQESITRRELLELVYDVADRFEKDNLPIDFGGTPESDESQLMDERKVFLAQLHLINVQEARKRTALSDFYRAFEQRSRWLREELLCDGEWDNYETHLIDEWKRKFDAHCEDAGPDAEEAEMISHGRSIFSWMNEEADLRIRERCTEKYVMRGSYHMLANDLRVGWHLDYKNRLNSKQANEGNNY